MKDEIEQLCLNIRYIRECEGMSPETMARLLHVSPQALEELEQGRLTEEVTVDMLFAVQKQFGIPPERLFSPFFHAFWEQ